MYSRLYSTVAVQSSLKMVKMTSANKQQKPRKTRCKKCEDENFINAVQEATDESIQIMTDIKAIIQETNSGKSQQRSRDHDSRDRPDLSLVERTTEAEPAHADQKQRPAATNKEGVAEPHPGQARAGNQWK